jgi:NAD(P)-binding Rossmann-like domain
MGRIETDYLIVGAGAAGMAFADALIADSDADVVLVDRRHRPGGHWNDAYPFVRLHVPSAWYGVNSRTLGSDCIDKTGPNAGMYERATASEICDYYQQVLDEHLLPSGQVRFFSMCDCSIDGTGEPWFTSRLTGETTTVRVRSKVVDARYLEPSIPATHTPSFHVEPGVRLIPVNDLVTLTEPPGGYTVIGGGKTAIDACLWLLDTGVPPEMIRWIRPREAWLVNRAYQQPLDLIAWLIEGGSLFVEAIAQAGDVGEMFRNLEACGQLYRLDPAVEPEMYRCATVSEPELASLRRIENVVRQGRVVGIGSDQVVLDKGSIPAGAGHVYVDCTAAGLRLAPGRPIFEPDLITVQPVRSCQPTFSAALAGYVEASRHDDAEKNRLCPSNPWPDTAADLIPTTSIALRAQDLWRAPDLTDWLERARLNTGRGLRNHLTEPRIKSALNRLIASNAQAMTNLDKFLEQAQQEGAVSPHYQQVPTPVS